MKFRTAKGNLTSYAFACGYVERGGVNDDIVLEGLQADKIIYRLTWWEEDIYHRQEFYRSLKTARKAFFMVKRVEKLRLKNT